jgi:lipoprotein signal peptidase
VRTANSGSALGFRQGSWVWIVLAAYGVLLIAVYAQLLRGAGWAAAIGVGLQVGGALPNLFDRVAFGGASDVLYVGGQVTGISRMWSSRRARCWRPGRLHGGSCC